METRRWRACLAWLLMPMACAQDSTTGLDGGPGEPRPEDAGSRPDAEPRDSGLVGKDEAVRSYRAYCESLARREEVLKTECIGGPPEIWKGQSRGSVEACVEPLREGLERGVWSIDTSELEACSSDLRTADCGWLRRPTRSYSTPPRPSLVTPCPGALVWAEPDGAGATCDISGPSTCGPSAGCAPRAAACGRCVPTPMLGEGETCEPASPSSRCAAGLQCSRSERRCRRRPSTLGDPCEGLSCEPVGFCPTEGRRTCQAFRALGEPCQFDEQCERTLRCVVSGTAAGTCQPYPALGSPCRFERDCDPGFAACVGPLDDGRCVPASGLGEPCQRRSGSSFVCAVGVCRGREGAATCQPWGGLGETCTYPDECAPALQCSGTCTPRPDACPE
jgi:hypothetical protein